MADTENTVKVKPILLMDEEGNILVPYTFSSKVIVDTKDIQTATITLNSKK